MAATTPALPLRPVAELEQPYLDAGLPTEVPIGSSDGTLREETVLRRVGPSSTGERVISETRRHAR